MRMRALIGVVMACSFAVMSWGSVEPSARAAPPEGSDVVLVDLGNAGEVATWTTVNDPVMGGRSTSAVTFGNGGLVFSGVLSLENNGGFASARGPEDRTIGQRATGATSLRGAGRGRRQDLRVEGRRHGAAVGYIQRFTTEPGVARTYDLPSRVSSRWACASIRRPRRRGPWTRRASTRCRSTSSTSSRAFHADRHRDRRGDLRVIAT